MSKARMVRVDIQISFCHHADISRRRGEEDRLTCASGSSSTERNLLVRTHLLASILARRQWASLVAVGLSTALLAVAAIPATADHQGTAVPSFDYQDHALVKPTPLGVGPEAVATGDFNGDGHDVAVGTIPGLQTLLSNGDGTFQDAVLHEVGNGTTRQVATADLNNDGSLDIAVSRQVFGEAPKVSLLFGAGGGTFASPVDIVEGRYRDDGKDDTMSDAAARLSQ